MSLSGSIREVSLGGRLFSVASDADSGRKLGGASIEVQANGDGTTRNIQTIEPWSVDGLTINMNDANGDQEYIQNLQDLGIDFVVLITYAGNISYQGEGQVNGEAPKQSQAGTGELALMGPGKLTIQ